MRPEVFVLIVSIVGILVSGMLVVDAYMDRRAVKRLADSRGVEVTQKMDRFTRGRGVAETIRLFVLLAWGYVAAAVLYGNERLRSLSLFVLLAIPALITFGSIHSFWLKRRLHMDGDPVTTPTRAGDDQV